MAAMIGLAAFLIVLGLAATSSGAEAAAVGYEGAAASVVTSELGIIAGGPTTPAAFARWQGLRSEIRLVPAAWLCGLAAIENVLNRGDWDYYWAVWHTCKGNGGW